MSKNIDYSLSHLHNKNTFPTEKLVYNKFFLI